jgi:CubicO group peptidase (beta-lactamase class C family)
MIRARAAAFFIPALLLLPWISQTAPAEPPSPPDWRALEAVARAEISEIGAPGGAVAVVSGDRVIWSKGFGVANVETGEAFTPSHVFHVGSVTKMLTAAALVSLAEQGKIRLDAPISSYAKGLDPAIGRLTLHQLLSQSSGMREIPIDETVHDEAALGEMARSLRPEALLVEPGRAFSYSNPGYALAGYVLEQATGKPYAEAMKELVFDPLGMNRSTLRPTMAMTWPLVLGHAVPDGGKPAVVRPMADDTRIWPAGYAFASTDDLSRFVIALLNEGKVDGRQAIPAGVAARMLAPHIPIPTNVFTNGRYGYGLILQDRGTLHIAEHGGQLTGYSSEIRMVPQARLAVITLANRENLRLEKTFAKVFEMILGAQPAAPARPKPALPIDETEMRRLAGSYDNRWKMDIFVRDGKLFLRRFGAELPITKVGENRYSVEPEGVPQPQEFLYLPARDGGPGAIQMFIWVFRRVSPAG